jgi:hypothetical protein
MVSRLLTIEEMSVIDDGAHLSSAQPIPAATGTETRCRRAVPDRRPDPGPSHPTQEEQNDHG